MKSAPGKVMLKLDVWVLWWVLWFSIRKFKHGKVFKSFSVSLLLKHKLDKWSEQSLPCIYPCILFHNVNWNNRSIKCIEKSMVMLKCGKIIVNTYTNKIKNITINFILRLDKVKYNPWSICSLWCLIWFCSYLCIKMCATYHAFDGEQRDLLREGRSVCKMLNNITIIFNNHSPFTSHLDYRLNLSETSSTTTMPAEWELFYSCVLCFIYILY